VVQDLVEIEEHKLLITTSIEAQLSRDSVSSFNKKTSSIRKLECLDRMGFKRGQNDIVQVLERLDRKDDQTSVERS